MFSNRERTDIVAAYREANNVCAEARRIYAARFPERRLPSPQVFRRTTLNLELHGAFAIPVVGNQRVVGNVELRRAVRQHVEADPHSGE